MSISAHDFEHTLAAELPAPRQTDSPRLVELVEVLGQAVDSELTACALALQQGMDIDTAAGKDLDRLADLIGLSRGGLSDDQLRTQVRARLAAALSDGGVDSIRAILETLYPASEAYVQTYGRGYFIVYWYLTDTDSLDSGTENVAKWLVNLGRAAGTVYNIVVVQKNAALALDGQVGLGTGRVGRML